MLAVHLNIGKQSKVITRGKLAQMCAQKSNQRILLAQVCGVAIIGEQLDSVFLENWFFFRQVSSLFILTGQLARDYLAGFDVWLIEGIDANDGTGYGGGDFPAEKLLANV